MKPYLNFKDARNDTLPPLIPTREPLLHILSVVGRNDILARLGVIHYGLGVREKAVETPIEDAGGDEGVNVADVETAQVEVLC